MQILSHKPITAERETEFIFTIVLRNLIPSNWDDLLPEAQVRMIEEVASLIENPILAAFKKQQLIDFLVVLYNRIGTIERRRIREILNAAASRNILRAGPHPGKDNGTSYSQTQTVFVDLPHSSHSPVLEHHPGSTASSHF